MFPLTHYIGTPTGLVLMLDKRNAVITNKIFKKNEVKHTSAESWFRFFFIISYKTNIISFFIPECMCNPTYILEFMDSDQMQKFVKTTKEVVNG